LPAADDRVRPRRLPALGGLLAILALSLAGGLAGCGGHADGPTDGAAGPAGSPAPVTTTDDPGTRPLAADALETAWAARPAYARAHPTVEAAYRYALERPDVLEWMPCYCGCGGMGHRSNLDCFLRSRIGDAVAFEEHGSYCGICVETALLAKQRMAEGRSLAEIRAEVDATFGGNGVPGTPTDLPQG
jgi:hypothetical protein